MLPSSVSAVWRLTFRCVVGEMYRRQTAMPVLHNLPEALRLRGTRQTPEVSSPSARQLSHPLSRTLRLTRLTTQTNARPRVERLEQELRQLKGSTSASPPPVEKSDTTAFSTPAPAQAQGSSTAAASSVQRPNTGSSSRYTAALQGSWTPTTGPSTPGGPSSTYHGPTSASHDGAVHERRNHRWFTAEREALMPNLLFAAAARQSELWFPSWSASSNEARVIFADR